MVAELGLDGGEKGRKVPPACPARKWSEMISFRKNLCSELAACQNEENLLNPRFGGEVKLGLDGSGAGAG